MHLLVDCENVRLGTRIIPSEVFVWMGKKMWTGLYLEGRDRQTSDGDDGVVEVERMRPVTHGVRRDATAGIP